MNARSVGFRHGWRWISAGIILCRRSPRQWLLLIAILFFGSRLLIAIPLVGLITVLIAPNIIAGLCHGAQALERGLPLKFGYLLSGFLKSAPQLLLIGAISLAGQVLMAKLILSLGGAEAISAIVSQMAARSGTQPLKLPEPVVSQMMYALLAASVLSAPLMMAAWFAPLLVFFDDVPPMRALALSLWACVKNILPFIAYASAVVFSFILLTPLAAAARQPDLGLWLLAPILVPSIYASYKDLFVQPN